MQFASLSKVSTIATAVLLQQHIEILARLGLVVSAITSTVTGADHSDRQNSGIEWKQLESVRGFLFIDRLGCTTQLTGDLIEWRSPNLQ